VSLTAAEAHWAPEIADASEVDAIAVHGLACWFDVEFNGSTDQRTLSTSPDLPRTHWYQTILPLKEPLIVRRGCTVGGELTMTKNRRRSYDIDIQMVRACVCVCSWLERCVACSYGSPLVLTACRWCACVRVRSSCVSGQVSEGGDGDETTQTKQSNVVFLQDMICRYLWSGRQH
jgi:hypothetical protein